MASSSNPSAAKEPLEPAPHAADEPENVIIEAESEGTGSETDSAFGDDVESYTTSLKSTVLNYRFENGRRYHAEKAEAYFLPNDESESDRLDLFHHIMTLRCDGELHLAPIGDSPQRILDLGTGTGIWAIDMGDKYPSAEVIGNDVSPIQPSMVPPNVKFEVDDIEQEWVFSNKFDFIHSRYLAGSIKDWPRLMQQAFKYTKPGGWIEVQDFDMQFYTTSGEFEKGCPLDKWSNGVADGVRKFGLEPEPGPKLEGWVKEAGFVNVEHRLLPIPVGTWPKDKQLKEIGAFDLIQFLDGLEGITIRVFTAAHGWSAEEVQIFIAQLRKDLKNNRLRAQHNFHVVYAQKPLSAK